MILLYDTKKWIINPNRFVHPSFTGCTLAKKNVSVHTQKIIDDTASKQLGINICIFMFVDTYSLFFYMCVRLYICVCKHANICKYMYIFSVLSIYIYIYVCIYIYKLFSWGINPYHYDTKAANLKRCVLICVHYVYLSGWIYVFYVGHIDELDYKTLFHVVNSI
jgi:hypothetical protein